jgi:anti-sigma-K factor RskA
VNNFDTSEPQEPRIRIPPWAWAAAIVAVLFFALNLWQARKMQQQLSELKLQTFREVYRKNQLERQKYELDQIRALLAAPETSVLVMRPASEEMPPFKLFWNEEIGLLVTSQHVPVLPAGRMLQLWIVPKKGSPISAGVFQPEANETVLKLTRPAAPIRMKDVAALTITVEPAGGSPQPTTKPAWVGSIT